MCTNTSVFSPSSAQCLVHLDHGDLLVADGVAKTYLRVEVATLGIEHIKVTDYPLMYCSCANSIATFDERSNSRRDS